MCQLYRGVAFGGSSAGEPAGRTLSSRYEKQASTKGQCVGILIRRLANMALELTAWGHAGGTRSAALK